MGVLGRSEKTLRKSMVGVTGFEPATPTSRRFACRVFQLSARSAQKASPRFWCAPGVRLPKKGPQKVKMGHQQIAGVLWKSVVLFRALGSICNGHPASKVNKNQVVTNSKKSISNATAISSPEGRRFKS